MHYIFNLFCQHRNPGKSSKGEEDIACTVYYSSYLGRKRQEVLNTDVSQTKDHEERKD